MTAFVGITITIDVFAAGEVPVSAVGMGGDGDEISVGMKENALSLAKEIQLFPPVGI